MSAARFIALPTWLLVQVLIHGMDHHLYHDTYPNLFTWAVKSPMIFRIFDIGLHALSAAFVLNLIHLTF